MNDYDVRLANGVVRFALAASKLAAAELALYGYASSRPPVNDPHKAPDCFVKESEGGGTEEPFWRAEGEAEPDVIPVEDLDASNDE